MANISTNEVNHLIWRYFKENGLELASLGLEKETNCTENEGDEEVPRDALINQLLQAREFKQLLKNAETVQPEIRAPTPSEGDVVMSDTHESDADKAAQGPVPATAAVDTLSMQPAHRLAGANCGMYSNSVVALGTPGSDTQLINSNGEVSSLRYALQGDAAQITSLAWSPDGALVSTGCFTGSIRIWTRDAQLDRVLAQHTAPITCLEWSRDSKWLLSVDAANAISLWEVSGPEGPFVPRRTVEPMPDAAPRVVVSWIDNRAYAESSSSEISIHKVGGGVPTVIFRGHSRPVTCMAYEHTSQVLASAGDDNLINVWTATLQTPLYTLTGPTGPIVKVKWLEGSLSAQLSSPNLTSQLLSAHLDGKICLWDPASSSLVWTLECGPYILAVEVSASGRLVAVATDVLVVYAFQGENPPKLVGRFVPPSRILSLCFEDERLLACTKKQSFIFELAV